MELKFCKENLPILVRLRHDVVILEAIAPLVKKYARLFAKTKTPSTILDYEDYLSYGYMAIIMAIDSCEVAKKDNEIDHEEYWSKFMFLCKVKLNSTLIEAQKKNYIPVKISPNVARAHAKLHALKQEGKDLSFEQIQEHFNLSPKLARELIEITNANFSQISHTSDEYGNTDFDVPVENTVSSDIFVKELLDLLNSEEREMVEDCVLGNKSIKQYSRDKNITYPTAMKFYYDSLRKLKNVVCDGKSYPRKLYVKRGN